MRAPTASALLLLAAPAAWLACSTAAHAASPPSLPGPAPAGPARAPTPAISRTGSGGAAGQGAPAPAAPTQTARSAPAHADAPPAWSRVPPDPKALRAILRHAPGEPLVAALVVDLDTGQTVLDEGARRPITPASVSKLFTTAAILRTLPGDFRFETRLLVSGRRGQARVKTLALVGGGDPTLQIADLDALIRAAKAAGIGRVDRLLIDSTLFDDALPRGFDEKDTDAAYRAPIDALQVRTSVVGVSIKPGPRPGTPVLVAVHPRSPAILVRNAAKTAKGRADRLQVRSRGEGRLTRISVTGTLGVRRRRGIGVRRRVHNARTFAGLTFRARLEAAGVKVGRTEFGSAAGAKLRRLALHRSRPLWEIVNVTNKTSHNGYAETLFKMVGARRVGPPGTGARAERGVREALADMGIDWGRTRLGNGSGLYHANRLPAASVVALLRGMYADRKVGASWRKTLAVAGRAGTLRGRMRGLATRGRIFAKTGTLDDVTALAGYALGPARRYAFALFFNRVKGGAAPMRRVHDRFLAALMDPSGATRAAVRRSPRHAKRRAERPRRRLKPAGRHAKRPRGRGSHRAVRGKRRRPR